MPDAAPVVLGGASWNMMVYLDRFSGMEEATLWARHHHSTAGSTGIGKAFALKALGHDPVLHATLGDDAPGHQIIAACDHRGITTVFDIDPAGTAQHVNLMDGQGHRQSIFLSNGGDAPLIDTRPIAGAIAQAPVIFLNITASSLPLLDHVANSAAPVWVDLHDYDGHSPWYDPFIRCADVVQLSSAALSDPEPVMEKLSRSAQMVICTRAAQGMIVLGPDGYCELPALPARIVDTNGAGDMAMVALWHALSAGMSVTDAARFALAAAAYSIEQQAIAPTRLTIADISHRAGLV